MREQDRHFLWSLYAAIAIILAWKGIWEGLREIPYIGDPLMLLFIGFAMLTFSGIIFKEFDPLGSLEKAVHKVILQVYNHPLREEFKIKYHDKVQKKDVFIPAGLLKNVEKNTLVFKHATDNKEVFIPINRVIEVYRRGKLYWRL